MFFQPIPSFLDIVHERGDPLSIQHPLPKHFRIECFGDIVLVFPVDCLHFIIAPFNAFHHLIQLTKMGERAILTQNPLLAVC